ncbi:MAG: hypothetical protein WC729_28160 [Sphingomonas sp.]|jgi:hypothetical protein|uniref:hypothetical protein n=1 Tax=Sphingomonas sp. TaxID=28214 RepID=UPI003566D6C4
MRIMMSAIAVLALAGCQAPPDLNVAQPDEPAATITNATAEVLKLPEGQRDMVFLRAIRDAGLDCQGVTRSERLDDTAGKPTWRVECTDRTAHLVQVTPDGTALVASRIKP